MGANSSISKTWRISISESPPWGLGQRLTHSIASWRDLTCQSQKPAMSSLVSVKGPSTTVRDLPENLTRAPLELGWRPSMASTMPALMSSSLFLPISAMSCGSGRAPSFSDSAVALTMTMNRIFFVLSSWDELFCGLFVELPDLGLAVACYFQEALGEFDGLFFGFGLDESEAA